MKTTAAKFDISNTLPPRLAALGLSANLFGKYCNNISSGEICSMLNGTKRINNARAELFTQTVSDLEAAAEAFSPAPLDWKDTTAIQNLIREMHDGTLLVATMRHGVLKIRGVDNLKFGDF